jgi:transposase
MLWYKTSQGADMRKEPEPLKLSATKLKELRTQYKHERDRRIAERLQCVWLFAQGYAVKELEWMLGVGRRTLCKWINVFRTQGMTGLRQWGYQGQAAELSDEQWAQVEQELARKPYHRARDVAAFVKEQFQIAYTERGMQALLQRKGYRCIKARLVPGDPPPESEQKAFIERYFELKATLKAPDRIYFVDAMHPTHNVCLGYVWVKKGKRWIVRSNTGRKRYNILGAYCPLDGEYIDIRGITNVNAQTLQQLIDQIRAQHPDAGRIVLLLDNARYNHARLVSEHIAGTNVELVFLLAYSPNLNLIERLWRFAKGHVMKDTYYETFEEFVAAFDQVLTNLDQYADELASLMTEKFEILVCG